MRDFFYKNSQILTEASTGGVCEKLVLKNFEIHRKTPVLATLLKRDSTTCAFLLNLQNFKNTYFEENMQTTASVLKAVSYFRRKHLS